MDSVQQLKLSGFMSDQKATTASIARSVASMNNDLAAAIQHQVYARKNPDNVVDAGLLAVVGVEVDELMAQFADVAAKQQDLLAVKNGTMTVEDLHIKYPFDLVKYSNALL
jgi:hypothetical protein